MVNPIPTMRALDRLVDKLAGCGVTKQEVRHTLIVTFGPPEKA